MLFENNAVVVISGLRLALLSLTHLAIVIHFRAFCKGCRVQSEFIMARSFLFWFVLLAINGVSAEYDEAVAKDMLVLAAAAYNTYPESCLSNRFENVEVGS